MWTVSSLTSWYGISDLISSIRGGDSMGPESRHRGNVQAMAYRSQSKATVPRAVQERRANFNGCEEDIAVVLGSRDFDCC